ncbi:hypothetical protein GCK32_012314 [Trichostrongylus colubriformis]|uniref:Uncharacterized protein n=1 Tax=Trichostrongylus colubriformis TaxID=6319 RepID=A0AAN8IJC3_TRICO
MIELHLSPFIAVNYLKNFLFAKHVPSSVRSCVVASSDIFTVCLPLCLPPLFFFRAPFVQFCCVYRCVCLDHLPWWTYRPVGCADCLV